MNKKRILIEIASVAAVGIFVLCGGLNFMKNNSTKKDTKITTDKNDSTDYALIEVSKDNFNFENKDFDEHAFIESVSSGLNQYLSEGKTYTTFVFDDGTGIYFPFSDISKSAQYGKINKNGLITEVYGYLTISGTHAVYKKAPVSVSNKSMDLYQYVPEKYQGDSLAICLDGKIIYACFSVNASSTEDAKSEAIAFCNSLEENGYNMSKIKKMYISIDNTYGFILNPNNTTEVTTDDTTIVDTVNNKFL